MLASQAEAAQRIGVSRTRMAQIMKLLTLSPAIQGAIFCEELRASERAIRPVLETLVWREQEVFLKR